MEGKVCVIGCGWLGLPLAKSLIEKGFQVKGSTTSELKLDLLKKEGIDPYLVILSSEGITGNLKNCLSGCETLILNIPPGFRKNPELNFVKQMQQIIPELESSTIKNVIYISSTSVYDDDISIPLITEDHPTSKSSEKAIQMVAVEQLFSDNPNFNTTVLRFSGLIGMKRHPATFLSGRSNVKNPEAPVNLIHIQDCIGIIERIIETSTWNTTFNASSSPHPTRHVYYTNVCKALNLPVPDFDQSQKSVGKFIDSSNLEQKLNYQFKVKLQ